MSNPNSRSSKPQDLSESGSSSFRRPSDSRRSAQTLEANMDSTARLRGSSGLDDDDDEDDNAGNDDGLFLGFEHCMNTDERRKMRELERAELEERHTRTRSSSPTEPSSRFQSRFGTKSTGTSLSSRYTRTSNSQDDDVSSKKSNSRRTIYSRELDKRDRQRDEKSLRSADDRSQRSDDNRRNAVMDSFPPSITRSRESSRRNDDNDVDSRKSTDAGYRIREELLLKSSRRREGERSGTHRSDRPRERSVTRSDGTKPSYRSKSSDFDEDAIERRRRREARQRRYEIEAEERRKRDSQNLPSDGRAIEDEEEERRRRRKLRLEERRLVGGVGGVGESNNEERRRRLEERRHDDERRRRNDERKHSTPVDSLEEDRRRRYEERKLREERRLARRSGENPTNANTAETSLNLDDDQVSRRNRTLDNRRKQSDAQQEDSQSISKDRLRQINDSDRQSRLGSGYGRRARSSDPDMRNIAESENTAWSIGLKGEKKSNDSLPTSLNRAVNDLDRNVSVRTLSRSELFSNTNPIPPKRQESVSGAVQRKAETLNSRGAENSSSESETEEEYEAQELSASENDEKWTIRISLISAVDLPFNVVPNIPLCPILKFGLIRSSEIENFELFSNTDATKNSTKSSIFEKIEKEGILSIPNSRVRCTSSKILSKRDNGSMDFHEEMRWDDVTRPSQILLAVELCARAAYPPPNMFEGPLARVEPPLTLSSNDVPLLGISEASDDHTSFPVRNFRPSGIGLSSTSKSVDYDDIFQCAIGKKSSEEISSSPRKTITDDGSQSGIGTFGFMGRKKQEPEKEEASESNNQLPSGIASMHLLWKKGRQQFETRQATKRKSSPEGRDIVTPAAAIGKFLIGVKDETRKKSTTSLQDEHEGEPTQRDTDPNPRRDVFRMTTSSTTDSASLGSSNLTAKRPFPQERTIRAGEENVALQTLKKKRKIEMAQDMRLGSLVIPLSKLSLEKAFDRKGAARIEQWYQLDSTNNSVIPVHNPTRRGLTTASKLAARRNPSVLLEISFSAPEVLDLSEDELEVDSDSEKNDEKATDESMLNNDAANSNISFSRRTSVSIRKLNKVTETNDVPEKSANLKKTFDDDPYLSSGICDFVAVVGASNIGDQSQDNGAKGWVNSNPECAILEQFPPNDDFHLKNKRFVTLQNKAEWFCFPEGCRLWRGAEPPSHTDLNLKRFSASSPGGAASSIAAFDACLNCTTSFSWFVIQSNEKENDFKNTRTYGAVIKFYAPAPPGIDSTQDDFAQGMRTSSDLGKRIPSQAKRLWVPLGILLTSNLPIVGVMEAMLLRLCEALASKTGGAIHSTSYKRIQQIIHQDLANLIINYQKPIPGVLHCSIPFLSGERLHVTVPPPTGLPPLPHGASVTSVCRLLGSEGLNFLLAAALTESKILIHSDEIANLPMVAEVATALIYPFIWALPYLPVLPESMLEFVEAPLSYFIGIPSCKMCEIDDDVLADIVVIDLDNGFTPSEHYDGRSPRPSKSPTPLPASVASNISKAVFRLLREEEEVEEEYGANNMHGTRSLPRLEAESLAEREFRIAVALQICSLVRGYEECLFKVSSNQPVFNRDKFLRTAPALFEDRRGNPPSGLGQPVTQSQKMLSPRSKRFLSILVNCQHFFQFLEMLDQDECAFFNEVMYTFDTHEDKKEQESSNLLLAFGSTKLEEAAASLSKVLQKVEDKIPTYRVERKGKKKRRGGWEDDDDDDGGIHDLIETNDGEQELGFSDDGNLISSFTNELLQQVSIEPPSFRRNSSSDGDDALTHVSDFSDGRNQGAMTAQFLAEFEKGNHWHYNKLFGIPLESTDEKPVVEIREKVKLRDAIGERRYRAWKIAQEQKNADKDSTGKILTGDISSSEANVALDLTSLLSQVSDETSTTDSLSTFSSFSERTRKIISTLTPEQQRVQDAKDRDVLRRCLEKAYEGGNTAQRRQARSNRLGLSHTMGGSENFENSGGRFGRNMNTQGQTGGQTDIFFENGRDLIADAEAALRNPSAQKFLISVLSQRSRLENQRKRRGASDDRGRRGGNQSTLSRLEPPAFDCLVRLCCAMLDACLENKNYEAGYNLLTQTQGFCSVHQIDGKPVSRKDSNVDNSNVIYMTARISLHPIFAESELWEGVLQMKLEEVEKERKDDDSESKDYTKDFDQIAYDTTVSTLYEMLAFGVPSEELARFATCVSEKKGWFATERGHNLLLQARRLSAKRENGNEATGTPGDLEIMRGGKRQAVERQSGGIGLSDEKEGKLHWKEIGWCHPAAVASSRPLVSTSQENESQIASNTKVGQSLLNMIGNENKREDPDTEKYLKRSPVTSLAVFGPSLVASGGLDGSVFVAHSFLSAESTKDLEPIVRGVRLDWGSSGSRTTVTATTSSSMDGEYGVGAVSCLAAANGAGIRNNALALNNSSFNRDVGGKHDEDDMLQAMEGCRVVAGTTGGDLRVWSVKEVVAATALTKRGESDDLTYPPRTTHGGPDGVTSSFSPRPKRGSITEIAAGSAFSRLKVSLRGRALSGHRGGVTCIDVPSHIYRPDTVVTGGADGFIKLWSLRNPTGRRASNDLLSASSANLFSSPNLSGNPKDQLSQTRTKGSRGSDALSILSGHTGRVLCIKTAWHGDRLLSGGADRTLRIWDLAGSGGNGKCLHELRGHLGWVTKGQYWGPNTIVSASNDRSIALWDPRVRRSPLFTLRFHKSPISDILVGSRTDPLMVSAAADGTLATWDFRTLSGSDSSTQLLVASSSENQMKKKANAVRTPSCTMAMLQRKGVRHTGTVLLARGPGRDRRTVLSIGTDAIIREWDISSGKSIRHDSSKHVDVVSSFQSFGDTMQSSGVDPSDATAIISGTITSSWDGTIRMRKLVDKSSR